MNKVAVASGRLGLLLGLVVLAGCFAPAAPDPPTPPAVTEVPGGLRPVAAPAQVDRPAGTVVAAILNQTSGGIAAFESGASGVYLFSDGTVLRFDGLPWGPRDRSGSCPALVQVALDAAAATMGANWTVDCRSGMVANATFGRMSSEAYAAVLAALRAEAEFAVPPERQVAQCCDRVYTGHRVWLAANATAQPPAAMEAHYLDEDTGEAPTDAPATLRPFVDQMAVLGSWMRSP